MDIDQIATQFVQSYYTTFDSDRSQLAALYVRLIAVMEWLLFHGFIILLQTQESVLSFEGTKFQGQQAISGKLTVSVFQLMPFTRDVACYKNLSR